MAHYRSSSEQQTGSEKFSLPNFSNFLAGVGQPDLSHRTEAGVNNVGLSLPYSAPSLPTPPATSGYSWPGEESRTQTHLDNSSNIPDHHPHGQAHGHAQPYGPADYRRRSSIATSTMTNYDNKPSRSYSFTSPQAEHNEFNSQQHGRIMHEEVIAGKGLCYIYEDGTICPKVVNGDTVNPRWGTTKAGKPRKRLGQACNTCREKKIKCDPSYPKCTQCQKLGRDCKFEAPSRPGQKSPKSRASMSSPVSGYVPDDELATRGSSAAPTEASTPTDPNSAPATKTPINTNNFLSPSASDRKDILYVPSPTKRLRLDPPESHHGLEPSPAEIDVTESQNHPELLGFGVDRDPAHIDPKLVDFYLDVYFTRANVAAFGLFPPTRFCTWARGEEKKEQDIMIMYAVLSLATIFSKNPDRLLHRRVFKRIAHELLSQYVYSLSLQTVQAGHLLSLVEFADGDSHQSFALSRQAASAACWLGLNIESSITSHQITLYGMTATQFAECKRRSFWAVYITERYGTACLGHPLSINHIDVFIRLPCDLILYDNDEILPTPFFDRENVVLKLNGHKDPASTQVGTMAYLAQIATLCSETQLITKRIKQNIAAGGLTTETTLHKGLAHQLEQWKQSYENFATHRYPSRTKSKDIDKSDLQHISKSDKLSGLHILHSLALISLNRQVYHPRLSRREITDHVRQTYDHSVKVLEIAQQLVGRGCLETMDYGFASTAPLTAFAVFMAVDVITAAGRISDVLENQSRMMQLLYSGIELLGQLSEYWASAKLHHQLAEERCQILYTRCSAGLMDRKLAFFVSKPLSPMSQILGMDFDLVYGISRMQFLQALGWTKEITNDNELLEIDVSSENLAQRGSRHSSTKSSTF